MKNVGDGGRVEGTDVKLNRRGGDELVLECQGQEVVVDSVSLPFLDDATIDFAEEIIGARFTIENPNTSSSCGCGTSFAM